MSPRKVLAVGLGPFNLGLAALAAPLDDVEVIVCEQRDDFTWHGGLLFDDATLQVPFIADLVTFADPTSPYSYLNFLKAHGRLYSFYIRESMYPLRREYNDYCRWVADQLCGIRYGHQVVDVERIGEGFIVTAKTSSGLATFAADALVVGTGTAPWLPPALAEHADDPRILHAGDYLTRHASLQTQGSVTVLGSGQSAAEVVQHLLATMPAAEVSWVTRSSRFFAMETSKLTLELTSPEYLRHFSALDVDQRAARNREEIPLYRGISQSTIAALYDDFYRRQAIGLPVPQLVSRSELHAVDASGDRLRLGFRHGDTGADFDLDTDVVIAATGYRHRPDAWADTVLTGCRAHVDARHCLDDAGRIFAQNTAAQPHGLTSHDLGMGPLRNSHILNTVTGRQAYICEENIAFQTFGVPTESVPHARVLA